MQTATETEEKPQAGFRLIGQLDDTQLAYEKIFGNYARAKDNGNYIINLNGFFELTEDHAKRLFQDLLAKSITGSDTTAALLASILKNHSY